MSRPVSGDVIRDHTEAALATMHLADRQVADGAPVPEQAVKSLELMRDMIDRILAHAKQQKAESHERAA